MQTVKENPSIDFVAELIKGLESSDLNVQIMAAFGLSQCHDRRAVEALKREVFSGSPICKFAAAALGNIASKDILPEIIQAFQNPHLDSNACLALRMLIEQIGTSKEVVPALKELLQDPTYQKKHLIIDTLIELTPEEVLEPILELVSDPNKEVRSAVARSLGHYTGETVFNVLLTLLDDESYPVREWAAYSLAKVGRKEAVPHLQRLAKEKKLREKHIDLALREIFKATE